MNYFPFWLEKAEENFIASQNENARYRAGERNESGNPVSKSFPIMRGEEEEQGKVERILSFKTTFKFLKTTLKKQMNTQTLQLILGNLYRCMGYSL